MNTHNLAIVFGPTLFQTDGQDYKAGHVVEDLISHYVVVFSVDEEELRKQREEITAIVKMRVAGTASGTQVKNRVWGRGSGQPLHLPPQASSCALSP